MGENQVWLVNFSCNVKNSVPSLELHILVWNPMTPCPKLPLTDLAVWFLWWLWRFTISLILFPSGDGGLNMAELKDLFLINKIKQNDQREYVLKTYYGFLLGCSVSLSLQILAFGEASLPMKGPTWQETEASCQ